MWVNLIDVTGGRGKGVKMVKECEQHHEKVRRKNQKMVMSTRWIGTSESDWSTEEES